MFVSTLYLFTICSILLSLGTDKMKDSAKVLKDSFLNLVFISGAIGSAGDPHGNAGRSSFTFFRGILRKECEESVTICVYVHNTFLNYAALVAEFLCRS